MIVPSLSPDNLITVLKRIHFIYLMPDFPHRYVHHTMVLFIHPLSFLTHTHTHAHTRTHTHTHTLTSLLQLLIPSFIEGVPLSLSLSLSLSLARLLSCSLSLYLYLSLSLSLSLTERVEDCIVPYISSSPLHFFLLCNWASPRHRFLFL